MVRTKNPFRELERLFEQMQENMEETNRWWETEPIASGGGERPSVKVDLEDREEKLVLTAELPGFGKDDIDVRVTDHTLHLEAEHEEEAEEETGEFIRRERHRASVTRSIRLPETVEAEEITATYTNGVLTVEMPKTEPVTRGTKIEVS
jgi:HSP20 family protein